MGGLPGPAAGPTRLPATAERGPRHGGINTRDDGERRHREPHRHGQRQKRVVQQRGSEDEREAEGPHGGQFDGVEPPGPVVLPDTGGDRVGLDILEKQAFPTGQSAFRGKFLKGRATAPSRAAQGNGGACVTQPYALRCQPPRFRPSRRPNLAQLSRRDHGLRIL